MSDPTGEDRTDGEADEGLAAPDASTQGAGADAGEAVDGAVHGDDELESGVDGRQSRRDERWRERAREAEARAGRLATREVLRLLGLRVADAQVALAMSGEQVRDLLNEDGDVDDEAVAALAAHVLASHPTLRPAAPHMDLGPKKTVSQSRSASWSGLIRGQ